jgi:hypothetical protein
LKARLLAQTLLEQPLSGVERAHGETPDGLSWTIDVIPYGSAAEQASWRYAPVQVSALVAWQSGETRHVSELKTLRLLSKAGP